MGRWQVRSAHDAARRRRPVGARTLCGKPRLPSPPDWLVWSAAPGERGSPVPGGRCLGWYACPARRGGGGIIVGAVDQKATRNAVRLHSCLPERRCPLVRRTAILVGTLSQTLSKTYGSSNGIPLVGHRLNSDLRLRSQPDAGLQPANAPAIAPPLDRARPVSALTLSPARGRSASSGSRSGRRRSGRRACRDTASRPGSR